MTAMWPALALLQPRDADAAAAAGLMAFGCMFWLIAMVFFWALPIICFWKIFSKAGYNGAMALLCFIPGLGMLIVLLILAFGDWPILQRR